jgi:hypothetical protein
MAEATLLSSARVSFSDPTPVDGAVQALSVNNQGRLRVASKQGQFPIQTAALSALNSQLAFDVADASNIVAHVKNTGTATMAAGAFVFEGSIDSTDGTDGTWFGLQAVRSNANTIETGSGTLTLTAASGQTYSWELSVNAVKWFRIRCTTAVTASAVATWTALRGSYATEPAPAVQPHAITGSVAVTMPTGTNYALTTAATTNAAVIKASSGNLFEVSVFNPTAAVIYAKLYNKTTAPTVGTDVPILVVPVPVNGNVSIEFGNIGKRFSSGIAIAATAGPLSTDTAAIAAGALISATYI